MSSGATEKPAINLPIDNRIPGGMKIQENGGSTAKFLNFTALPFMSAAPGSSPPYSREKHTFFNLNVFSVFSIRPNRKPPILSIFYPDQHFDSCRKIYPCYSRWNTKIIIRIHNHQGKLP